MMFRASTRGLSILVASALMTVAARASAATLVGGIYPFAVGDTFVYDYAVATSVETAEGTTKTNHSYATTTTTIDNPITYNGVKMYPYVTTGSYSASDGVTVINDTEYRNYVSSGSRTFSYSYAYTDTSVFTRIDGVILRESVKRIRATPLIYDVLPESLGSLAEPVAYTQTTDDHYETSLGNSNVLSENKVVAADGSNRASGMSYDVPFSRLLNPNGTGTSDSGPSQGGVSWSFGLPQVGGSGHVIPATETYDSKTATNLVPDWFPGHAAASKPLATNVIQDLGKVTSPSGCGKRAGLTATDLRLTYTGLDPVYGDTYDETIDYFAVPGIGRICRLDHIVETDYNNTFKGTKKSITTTDSTDILVSESIH